MAKLGDLLSIDYENLEYKGLSNAKKQLGVSYLGGINTSSKLVKGLAKNYSTYGVYLLSSDSSGIQVCSDDKQCKEHCLSTSGMAKLELLGGLTKIQNSRMKKTLTYGYNKEFFTRMLVDEIRVKQLEAEVNLSEFCVRVNCSSDIALTSLKIGEKNVLEILPLIKWYDYTKNLAYVKYAKKYPQLHLTFSYSGSNWLRCLEALKMDVNIAVVFDCGSGHKMPKKFCGIDVIDATENDLRFLDPKGVICGLCYKTTAKDIKNHKETIPNTRFIVKKDDPRCEW
jgi:hypothetical protein